MHIRSVNCDALVRASRRVYTVEHFSRYIDTGACYIEGAFNTSGQITGEKRHGIQDGPRRALQPTGLRRRASLYVNTDPKIRREIQHRLLDLGVIRLEEMDKASIGYALLSSIAPASRTRPTRPQPSDTPSRPVTHSQSSLAPTQTLLATMSELSSDHVLFSTDYPYESMQEAASWFDNASISETDRFKIGGHNARRSSALTANVSHSAAFDYPGSVFYVKRPSEDNSRTNECLSCLPYILTDSLVSISLCVQSIE